MTWISRAGVVVEWLELASLACGVGALVLRLWVVRPARADASPGEAALLAPLQRLLGIAAAVLLAAGVVGLLLRSAEMGGAPLARVLPLVPTVLLRTHLGHTWMVRMAAVAVLAVAVLATGAGRGSRATSYLMLACAALVSATSSASGHASDAGDLGVAEVLDFAHLAAAMVWGGGLLALALAILPRLEAQGDGGAGTMGEIAARFSTVAGWSVAAIALTAAYQAWANARGVEALLGSAYGRTVVAKIVLFVLLVLVGAFNRWVVVPRLQRRAAAATTVFTRAVEAEAVLVALVLLCSALLRHEEPARHAVHHEHHARAEGPLSPPSRPARAGGEGERRARPGGA